MAVQLEMWGSPVEQGSTETVPYSFNPGNLLGAGETVRSVVVKAYEVSQSTGVSSDVSATVLFGSPVIDQNKVYQAIRSLTLGKKYRVEVTCTITNTKIVSGFMIIKCVV